MSSNRCKHCDSVRVRLEVKEGSVVCLDCGVVQTTGILDEQAELFICADDDRGRRMNRLAPMTDTSDILGVRTNRRYYTDYSKQQLRERLQEKLPGCERLILIQFCLRS